MEKLQIAKQNLKTSATLKTYKLPCREREFDQIYDFILTQYNSQSGGCLYLAGVPGTGKTATVRGVRKSIEENLSKLKIKKNSLIFVEVNGLKLTDPYQCYSQVYHGITGKRTIAKKAEAYLNNRFSHLVENDQFVILIVDELDSLQTSKQDILYHLFDWPVRSDSKLVVIAIANTHDLPERLGKRIVSRAGFGRVPFHPYKFDELQKIVMARLKGVDDSFAANGIQLMARKVASISGDARKVLEISRRAIEIAEEEFKKLDKVKGKLQVSMDHFLAAMQETTQSPKMIYMRDASDWQKNLLQAICKHFAVSGTEEGTCTDIFGYWSNFCSADGFPDVNFSEFLEVAHSLHESRLIILEPDKVDDQRRIRLVVSTDDVDFALKMDKNDVE